MDVNASSGGDRVAWSLGWVGVFDSGTVAALVDAVTALRYE